MTDSEAIETIEYARAFNENHTRLMVALDCAITALQEREERSERCERCQMFENDPQFLCSRGNGQYDEVIFKYCPVCGRPLKTAMPGEEV